MRFIQTVDGLIQVNYDGGQLKLSNSELVQLVLFFEQALEQIGNARITTTSIGDHTFQAVTGTGVKCAAFNVITPKTIASHILTKSQLVTLIGSGFELML